MGRIMRRLESGERWWTAEIALRSFGLVLLGLCALSSLWLYGSVHTPPHHAANALEYLAALLAVLFWSLGCAFFAEGPGLFKLIDVPARYRRFTL
jgi:hypothetical protein